MMTTTTTATAHENKKRRALPEWMLAMAAAKKTTTHTTTTPMQEPKPSVLFLMTLIERAQLAKDLLERILDPPALTWNLFDDEAQEAELRAQVESGAFVLDESELMEHMTVGEVSRPIALYCPELWKVSERYYMHDPALLLRDLDTAIGRMCLMMVQATP